MRYFYDTEFIENGATIELISIGVVAEDGREYYAISTDFDPQQANDWVAENVLEKLPPEKDSTWKSLDTIREELFSFFLSGGSSPELWAWVGAYDHVVLAQLWGDMTHLPKEIPRFTHELKQYWEMAGRPKIPTSPVGAHNALVDARSNVAKFQACMDALPLKRDTAVAHHRVFL